MRKNICEAIRVELDELMPGEACSSAASAHLHECAACREFHDKQTKLRQIVGSLGTVSAPADFDFRLRARLANESSSAVSTWQFVFPRRGFAVAAVLLVFATGAFLVRNVWNQPPVEQKVATADQPRVPEAPQPAPSVEQKGPENTLAAQPFTGTPPKPVIRNERPAYVAVKPKRSLVSEDFSSEGAQVIRSTEAVGAFEFIPLDASLQSLNVSLEDGRGTARTNTVPAVSFGSQSRLQTANQLTPKRDW
jgi:anti-sigma factor RsiW